MPAPISGKRVVFFDMFSTLSDPHDAQLMHLEYEVLRIAPSLWDKARRNPALTLERNLGKVSSPREMVKRCCDLLPVEVTDAQIDALTLSHAVRMRAALTDLPREIMPTLEELKRRGYRTAIISDCDYSDIASWDSSPLKSVVDTALFSCEAGTVKPDERIFALGLERMGCIPEEAVYVGDGGSNELQGAKALGMTTVRTEYLLRRNAGERTALEPFSDRVISHFTELLTLLPPRE